jgi:hypothetical protein
MGQARILGRDAKIFANLGTTNVFLGEVDKFNAKKLDELKKSQPLGEANPTSNVVHAGWELSFEGGKVDWSLAQAIHAQDQQITSGGRSPYFTIKQKITYMNGKCEEFEYQEVSIYGYEIDMGGATEEISEKVTGFAGKRVLSQATDSDIKSTTNNIITGITGALAGMPEKPTIFAKTI